MRWQRRRQGRRGERHKRKGIVGRDATRLRGNTYLLRLRAGLVRAVVALATGPDGVPSCYAEGTPPWPSHRSAVIPRTAAGIPSIVVVAANKIAHLHTPLLAHTVFTVEHLHHHVQAWSELRTGTVGGGSSDYHGTGEYEQQLHSRESWVVSESKGLCTRWCTPGRGWCTGCENVTATLSNVQQLAVRAKCRISGPGRVKHPVSFTGWVIMFFGDT